MLVLNAQLTGASVMSLQTGGTLGVLAEPIIDPRKLMIVAYYVVGPRVEGVSVLHTSDIREIGPLGIIVDGAESIMSVDEDLVRLQEVINFRFNLLNKLVINEDKKKLGKVTEYTLDTESFLIQKIHVGQSVIKNFKNSNLLIHRSQVVEISNEKITVRSGSIPDQVGLAQVLNPFRKAPNLSPEASAPQIH